MPRRRTAPLTALVLSLALGLGACAGEESETSDPDATASPTTEGTDGSGITLERADDTFTPQGTRVEVPVGEPVTVTITADEAGELHVHSTPGQEIAYEAGTSTHEVTIDRPGIVEVESHDPGLVVLQLEAR